MNPSKVHLVSHTQEPFETILCAWFNSRDMGEVWTKENIWDRLVGPESNQRDRDIFKRLLAEKCSGDPHKDAVELFYHIIEMDIPITEFISFNFSFDNVTRSWMDQFDRSRYGIAYWERSLRVVDLSDFDHYIPTDVGKNPLSKETWLQAMKSIRSAYKDLLEDGVRPEDARGIIPMFVLTRGDAAITLRTLKGILKKRGCFFAQADQWHPIVKQIIDLVLPLFPDPDRMRKILSPLPCHTGPCPYRRDIMDRLVDKSNPICPILYMKELDTEERDRTCEGMADMYGMIGWIEGCLNYMRTFYPELENGFVINMQDRGWLPVVGAKG